MNCLTCQALPRTQSERESYGGYESSSGGKSCCMEVTRRWSAELSSPSYKPMKNHAASASGSLSFKSFLDKKVKKKNSHLRRDSDDGGNENENENENEPRLVRSSGMRRDWSFEDLRFRDKKKGRFH